jgi:hypothetical protein
VLAFVTLLVGPKPPPHPFDDLRSIADDQLGQARTAGCGLIRPDRRDGIEGSALAITPFPVAGDAGRGCDDLDDVLLVDAGTTEESGSGKRRFMSCTSPGPVAAEHAGRREAYNSAAKIGRFNRSGLAVFRPFDRLAVRMGRTRKHGLPAGGPDLHQHGPVDVRELLGLDLAGVQPMRAGLTQPAEY